MKTPESLEGWTLAAIEAVLAAGTNEGLTFDFKEDLPHRSDKTGKASLHTDCAAFANTSGGFLILGVKNDRALSPIDRMFGIDASIQFMENFAPYPSNVTPRITQTPHRLYALPNSRVIYVIEIPRSQNRPHAVGTPKDGWKFPYRTDAGTNDYLKFDEVKDLFLNIHKGEAIARELMSELESIRDSLMKLTWIHIPTKGSRDRDEGFQPPVPLDLSPIERSLGAGANVFSDADTLRSISQLRRETSEINDCIGQLRSKISAIGEVPPEPALGGKLSVHMIWQERKDEVLDRQADAGHEFMRKTQSIVQSAATAAGRASAGIQRFLQRRG